MRRRALLRLLGAVVMPLAACAIFVAPRLGAKPQPSSIALAAASAAAPQAKAPAASAQVTLSNLKFEPPSLTVTAGTTVTWTNKENSPHTVTADDSSFSSPNLNHNATFSHAFMKPGKYAYHCAYHGGKGSGMAGTITVTAGRGAKKR
jgi:plastocyanin